MIELVIYILACAGATQIIVWGKIFKKIREKIPLLDCSQCVGFWVGIIFAALSGYTPLFNYGGHLFTIFLMACISSLMSYIFKVVFDDNGIAITKIRGDKYE